MQPVRKKADCWLIMYVGDEIKGRLKFRRPFLIMNASLVQMTAESVSLHPLL